MSTNIKSAQEWSRRRTTEKNPSIQRNRFEKFGTSTRIVQHTTKIFRNEGNAFQKTYSSYLRAAVFFDIWMKALCCNNVRNFWRKQLR